MTMPFGKYCGVEISALADSYLTWLRSRDVDGDLDKAIEREYQRRFGPHPNQRQRVMRRLKDLYDSLRDQSEGAE
jgi:hypothetical protein